MDRLSDSDTISHAEDHKITFNFSYIYPNVKPVKSFLLIYIFDSSFVEWYHERSGAIDERPNDFLHM